MSGFEPPSVEHLASLRREVVALSERVGLAVPVDRGRAGAELGVGTGASLEYEDHRPFVPGDDPRHIDWLAYGRTDQPTLKVYRAEVTPSVDLLLDGSRSMDVLRNLRDRAFQLALLAAESARRVGASLRVWVDAGGHVRPLDPVALAHGSWPLDPPPVGRPQPPRVEAVGWRRDALRVWVTDLMFGAAPDTVLAHLAPHTGRAVVLVAWSPDALSLPLGEAVSLVDAETGARRVEVPDTALQDALHSAYRRHLEAWRRAARRRRVALVRVPADRALRDALTVEALPAQVVQSWT